MTKCKYGSNPNKLWYYGICKAPRPKWGIYVEIFSSSIKPAEKLYGHIYSSVVGPFKTKQKAEDNAQWIGYFIKRNNPPKSLSNATEIYDNIMAIEAQKGDKSLWPDEYFRHDFTKKGAKIYGLSDGSLLIKGKKRLWKNFNYNKEDV